MFFDRPAEGERALLVDITLPGQDVASQYHDQQELASLTRTAGADPVGWLKAKRTKPDPATALGSGKVEELAEKLKELNADLVIYNGSLRSNQGRNLEAALNCKVIDRTELILDIFAQRARSHEGKLQVTLAQLQHTQTRLTRGWTHLDRQKGGVGMRGAGEKQLEMDQRIVGDKITRTKRQIQKIEQQRALSRRARQQSEIPTIALVGYTNAGKSTLFNQLSSDKVLAADQLFATLDATLRNVNLPQTGDFIVADTVGFIRQLPHTLVQSFRATLDEVTSADLLLHVIDSSSPYRDEQIEQVYQVLEDIGAQNVPVIEVFNKSDLLTHTPQTPHAGQRVWLSAKNNTNLADLDQKIARALNGRYTTGIATLSAEKGYLRGLFYKQPHANIEESINSEGQITLRFKLFNSHWQRLAKQHPELLECCEL